MKLHTRVSPALVVAMLALLVAIGGSADAAKRLITGRDIKNASITGLDVKNKSLTAADIRGQLRGPRGPAGVQGAAGTPGAQGPQGLQGPQGPFPGSDLPVGRTVRGNWAATGVATSAGQYDWDEISFGFTFATAPTGQMLAVGAAPTAECPGSLSAPEAAPGYLCVYTQLGVNINTSQTLLCDPVGNICGATHANRYGTTVRARALAAGLFYTWGTWAATA